MKPKVLLPDGWTRVLGYGEPAVGLPRRMYHTRMAAEVQFNWVLREFSVRYLCRSKDELLWRRAEFERPQGRGWRQRLVDIADNLVQLYVSKEDGR